MRKLIYIALICALTACGDNANRSINISDSCSIDTPSTNATVSVGQNFIVGGWAFDKQSTVAPDKFSIQFTSTNRQVSKTFDVKNDVKRPDVAKALNAPKAESSGFNLVVKANSLAPGNYEISILQHFPNAISICGKSHLVQVK